MDKTRLTLEGVDTPIVTQVRELREGGMTVEQSLPFLRLQTGVLDADDNRSRIESVSLVVADGVPRLVLDLAYDGAPYTDAVPAAEASLDADAHMPLAGVARTRRPDETLEYEIESPPPEETPARAAEPATDEAPREPTQVFKTHAPEAGEPSREEPSSLSMEEQLILSAKPSYRLAQRWARIEPHLRRAAGLTRDHGIRLAHWAWPRLLLAARATATASLKLVTLVHARFAR
ncbi:MAG: hypothetical protein OXT09_08020 [Myxococcales bacterium]|nr:hypothetical protein [Myxococcales bacterium]